MYFYYQKEGGTEEWKIVPAEEVTCSERFWHLIRRLQKVQHLM